MADPAIITAGAMEFVPCHEASLIEESVSRRGIREIYHFTPLRQIAGILVHHGIHPRSELRARGIIFDDNPLRWGNAQKAEDLADYISVGIARAWGMMQHYPDCIVFGLNRRLLWRDGTAFVGSWSSHNQFSGLDDARARETAGCFDELFDNPSSSFPSPVPGEVLVRGSIPLEEVTFLYVRSQEHLDLLRETVRQSGVVYKGPALHVKKAAYIFGR